jgi:large subunit ribosomal protein L25
MEEITLQAQLRAETGKSKVKSLRDSGLIPAVVYAAGKKTENLKLGRHDFLRLIHQYHLESTLISLKIKGEKARAVLVKDIQYEPVQEEIIHVDFQEISLTEKIKVNVRVVTKGEPIGVKQEGGTLNHLLWELEVECLPTQIPEEITVDVSELKIGDNIHVKDLTLPVDVKAINNPEDIVIALEAPIKEEEIAPVPAEGEEAAEPEVIKEKKEIAEGEEKEGKPEKETKPKEERPKEEKQKEAKQEGSSKK